MTIETKYKVLEKCYIMNRNRIMENFILSINIDIWINGFWDVVNDITYELSSWIRLEEEEIHPSREELFNSLN